MATVILVVPDAVGNNPEKTKQDFQQIAATITSEGLRCRIVRHRRSAQIRLLPFWLGHTVSISMFGRNDRKFLPGRFFAGQHKNKIEEYRTLQAAGVAVPQWEELRPGTKLSVDQWGPYVVEKPSAGSLGANVTIKRTTRVKYVEPSAYSPRHRGRRGPMIIQKFVYTGEWPVSWRVVTVFGKVVLCYRQTTERGSPLRTRWAFDAGGVAIVSNTNTMKVELDADQEIMDAATEAHLAAFPDVPVLHFDISRDVDTGEIAVFESHPHHPYWPFSSKMGLSIQSANGISFDSQFDAMPTIGRAIAEKISGIFS